MLGALHLLSELENLPVHRFGLSLYRPILSSMTVTLFILVRVSGCSGPSTFYWRLRVCRCIALASSHLPRLSSISARWFILMRASGYLGPNTFYWSLKVYWCIASASSCLPRLLSTLARLFTLARVSGCLGPPRVICAFLVGVSCTTHETHPHSCDTTSDGGHSKSSNPLCPPPALLPLM